MTGAEDDRGLAVLCDLHGAIKDVLVDEHLVAHVAPGIRLADLVDAESRDKMERFLRTVKDQGVALDWHVAVPSYRGLTLVLFAGAAPNLIVAGATRAVIERVTRAVAPTAGHPADELLRRLGADLSGAESPALVAMAQLNNQLATLHREMARQQAELAEKNAELEELHRLKSLFFASVGHEIRTPLNSIIGFTKLLRDGVSGSINPEQKKQLDIVHQSAKHLLALIGDVLDIQRIESGHLHLVSEEVLLKEVVDEAVAVLAPLAAAKKLRIRTSVPSQTRVETDRQRLLQILLNLIGNAIKFTDEGTIAVEVRGANANQVRVQIADTGAGIAADAQSRLFQPFQGHSGQVESAGLGLYLCRQLLDRLGGEIGVESAPGQGSRFWFTLPSGRRQRRGQR